MNVMDTVFANTNFADEADSYIFYGITDREDVEADVRECLREHEATEEDVQEYTNKIMDAIDGALN
jgi:hypothetical protein